MKEMKKFTLISCIIFLLIAVLSYSHPGGTDKYGCHTCRTNCEEKWGIPYGFYHRHNPIRPCFEETETQPIPSPSPTPSPAPTPSPPSPSPSPSPDIKVYRIIDGDTIELTNGERVRLIGIDSAEVGQCYYLEAKNKLEDLLQGKEIRLGKDISERDKYGRLLSYIYIGNIFVNHELVRQGYARAYRYKPDVKFADYFQEAEDKAKEEKLGLWSKCFPSSEKDKISTPITAKVVEEEKEAVTTISKPTIKPNETKKTIPKFVMQKNQTNETKILQKQVVTTPSKKEKGFFKSVTSWFLNLFR